MLSLIIPHLAPRTTADICVSTRMSLSKLTVFDFAKRVTLARRLHLSTPALPTPHVERL
jgi:hypothetical protein